MSTLPTDAQSERFDLILALLPAAERTRAKAYVASAGALASVLLPLIPNVPTWVGVVLAVATGLGVFAQRNATSQQSAIAAAVAAGVPLAVDTVAAGAQVVAALREGGRHREREDDSVDGVGEGDGQQVPPTL